MKFKEIIRISNSWPEMDEFDKIHKLVEQKRLRQALCYIRKLSEEAPCSKKTRLRTKVTDPTVPSDKVLYSCDQQHLCACDLYSGIYSAYYLVQETT